MSEKETPKKSVNKKSIGYVRPPARRFTLENFPGIEFCFRKATLADDSWCQSHFDCEIGEFIAKNGVPISHVAKFYFHFLDDDSKAYFKPEERDELDEDSGEKRKVFIGPWKKFMESIACDTPTELTGIVGAFVLTLHDGRPASDLDPDLKKNLAQARAKAQPAPTPEPPKEANA